MPMRCLFLDLDGTLLGPGGGLFAAPGGGFSLLGARALEACHRADVEVCLYSGRRLESLERDARLLGVRAFAFEAGAGVMVDGDLTWLTGDLRPNQRTIHEQIEDTGAPALLLDTFAGRLEAHEPWSADREVSHLFRGLVDVAAANALLAEHGHDDLRLLDNGAADGDWSASIAALPQVRVYHLVPTQASKAVAVATIARMRGYAAEACVAVGDSREDIAVAGVVGTFWLVANALVADPELDLDARDRDNVRVTEGAHGEGVYEAVVTTLAEGG